ncbi:MAG: hypothetical protein LBM25_02695 [Bacteroidales bacterium]|nr:hypothetical protein [Bacteroidales bacterium]
MRTKKITIFFLLVQLLGTSLLAQDEKVKDFVDKQERKELNESIIISAQFDPTVSEATKISENPSIFDTNFATPSFKYEVIDKLYVISPKAEEIKPAKVKGEPIEHIYNGNIKGGIGTYLTPYFEGSYSQGRDRSFLYSINARHYSSHWSINDRAKSHFANNSIDVFAKKIWEKFIIDAKAYYNNSINYFYGFDNTEPKLEDKDYRTIWNTFGAKAFFASSFKGGDPINFIGDVGFENTSNTWGSGEFLVRGFIEAKKPIHVIEDTRQDLGLMLAYSQFNNTYDFAPLLANEAPFFSAGQISQNFVNHSGLLNIMPMVDFDIQKFHFHLSFAIALEMGDYPKSEEKTTVNKYFPTILVSFPFLDNKFSFKGGYEAVGTRYTLAEMVAENPFMLPLMSQGAALSPSDFRRLFVNVQSSFAENFSFSIEGGWQKLLNHYFFITDPRAKYENIFGVIRGDVERLFVKANINYNIIKVFSVGFNLEAQSYSNFTAPMYDMMYPQYEKLDFAPYMPTLNTSLSLQYKPIENLSISVLPSFQYGNKAYVKGEKIDMKGHFDLSMNCEYRYNEQLSMFVKLNNITFQRYEFYYNYPSQRFMGMIGASFSF